MSDETTKTDISKPANPDAKPGESGHLSKPVADAVGSYGSQFGAKPQKPSQEKPAV